MTKDGSSVGEVPVNWIFFKLTAAVEKTNSAQRVTGFSTCLFQERMPVILRVQGSRKIRCFRQGPEKVPDASDKTVKSTECKETRRETEVSILIKELFNSDIRTEREIIQIQKGLEKEESQDRPKEAI